MRLGTTEDIENKYLTVHRRNQFIYSGFFISNTYFFPLSNCYFWGIPSPPHWNRQQQTYARFFFFAFLSSIPFLLVTRFLGKGREKKMGSWHHLREKKRGRGDFRRFGGFFRGVGVCVSGGSPKSIIDAAATTNHRLRRKKRDLLESNKVCASVVS